MLFSFFFSLRRRVVADGLVVDRLVGDVLPVGSVILSQRAKGLEPPLEQPLRLVLLGRDQADDVLVEPLGHDVLLDVGDEPVLVFGVRQLFDDFGGRDSSGCLYGKRFAAAARALRVRVLQRETGGHQVVLVEIEHGAVEQLQAARIDEDLRAAGPSNTWSVSRAGVVPGETGS